MHDCGVAHSRRHSCTCLATELNNLTCIVTHTRVREKLTQRHGVADSHRHSPTCVSTELHTLVCIVPHARLREVLTHGCGLADSHRPNRTWVITKLHALISITPWYTCSEIFFIGRDWSFHCFATKYSLHFYLLRILTLSGVKSSKFDKVLKNLASPHDTKSIPLESSFNIFSYHTYFILWKLRLLSINLIKLYKVWLRSNLVCEVNKNGGRMQLYISTN